MLKICHDGVVYTVFNQMRLGTMHLCVQWRWSRVASFFKKVCLSEAQGCQQNCSHHWSKLSLWALPSAVRKVVIEIELNIQHTTYRKNNNLEKGAGMGLKGFHIKWIIVGTHCNWKKSKCWEPFRSYQLNSTANPGNFPQNGPKGQGTPKWLQGFWFFQLPWVPFFYFLWRI